MDMTIKNLYEWAKAKGIENNLLVISYACDDDWYSFDCQGIEQSQLSIFRDMVNIQI